MPKVIIAEKDLTSAEAIQYDDHIVLIPGTKSIADLDAGAEAYFTNAAAFKNAIDEAGTGWDVATKMVYRLLQLGMTVLYRVVSNYSELDVDYDNSSSFWAKYADKGEYNLRFLTCGSYASQASAQNAIKCAAERGDAIALIDIPTDLVSIELFLSSVFVSGSIAVDSSAFDTSGLKLMANFSSGDYTEVVDKTSSATFTCNPATPESEEGEHTVLVTGSYTDASGTVWTSPIATFTYIIE